MSEQQAISSKKEMIAFLLANHFKNQTEHLYTTDFQKGGKYLLTVDITVLKHSIVFEMYSKAKGVYNMLVSDKIMTFAQFTDIYVMFKFLYGENYTE